MAHYSQKLQTSPHILELSQMQITHSKIQDALLTDHSCQLVISYLKSYIFKTETLLSYHITSTETTGYDLSHICILGILY